MAGSINALERLGERRHRRFRNRLNRSGTENLLEPGQPLLKMRDVVWRKPAPAAFDNANASLDNEPTKHVIFRGS